MNFLKKFFKKEEKPQVPAADIALYFNIGEEISYKDAKGLFEYRGDVYYRHPTRGGKRLKDNASFTDIAFNNKDYSKLKDIGTVLVRSLSVVEYTQD